LGPIQNMGNQDGGRFLRRCPDSVIGTAVLLREKNWAQRRDAKIWTAKKRFPQKLPREHSTKGKKRGDTTGGEGKKVYHVYSDCKN